MSHQDLPHCPNCHRPQEVKGENDTHWAFRCRWCHTTRIVSKPTHAGISRLENALQRKRQEEARQRYLDSRPTYSFPKELR